MSKIKEAIKAKGYELIGLKQLKKVQLLLKLYDLPYEMPKTKGEAKKIIINLNKNPNILKEFNCESKRKKRSKKFISPGSPIEDALNEILIKTDLKFIRQHPIGQYFVDFYFSDIKLIVECDGYDWHNTYSQMENDFWRQNYLILEGYKILRYSGKTIYNNVDRILQQINFF